MLRIPYAHEKTDEASLNHCLASIARRLETPGNLVQVTKDILATDYHVAALYAYALGRPLEEVRKHLHDSAKHLEMVYDLMGTEPGMDIVHVTLPDMDAVKNRTYTESRSEPEIDYSITNSKKGLGGIFDSLCACDSELAASIAKKLYDPPDASYIFPRSQTCTPQEQRLAFATRHLLLGSVATVDLDRIDSIAKGRFGEVSLLAALFMSIAANNAREFYGRLNDHIAWFASQAAKKRNQDNIYFYLNIPAIAYVSLASMRKLISLRDYESVPPHFCMELLTIGK